MKSVAKCEREVEETTLSYTTSRYYFRALPFPLRFNKTGWGGCLVRKIALRLPNGMDKKIEPEVYMIFMDANHNKTARCS